MDSWTLSIVEATNTAFHKEYSLLFSAGDWPKLGLICSTLT